MSDTTCGLAILLKWFRDNEITWDEDLLEVRSGLPATGGGSLGVYAKVDIEEGAVLCEIPKSSMLSVKTTSIADILEEAKIAGGLGLLIALMHEYSLGETSRWWGYLQSLPVPEYIPIFWTNEELLLLQGTGCEDQPLSDRKLTQEDFEETVVPLLEQYPERLQRDKFTLDMFRTAASWLSSRRFGVDSFHGTCMVPFADLFNHKSAIVALSENYRIERGCLAESSDDEDDEASSTEDDADAQCSEGTLTSETHEDCRSPTTAPLCEDGTEELESDDIEEANAHVSRGGSRKLPAISRGQLLQPEWLAGQDLRLEIGICGIGKDGTPYLQVVAACPIRQGAEIHNTYGELGNADLVVKYGFALPNNPFSSVEVAKSALLACAQSRLGQRSFRARARFLNVHSELLEEEAEPFELLPGGVVNPCLLAVLRILFACDAEFYTWHDLPDAFRRPPDLRETGLRRDGRNKVRKAATLDRPQYSSTGRKRKKLQPNISEASGQDMVGDAGNGFVTADGDGNGSRTEDGDGNGFVTADGDGNGLLTADGDSNWLNTADGDGNGSLTVDGDGNVLDSAAGDGRGLVTYDGGGAAGGSDFPPGSLKLSEEGRSGWLLSMPALEALRDVALQRLEAYPTGADPEADQRRLPAGLGAAWSPDMTAKAAALTLLVDEKTILWDIVEAACTKLGVPSPRTSLRKVPKKRR